MIKVFISFDYENDSKEKDYFVQLSKWKDFPFSIKDMSIKTPRDSNWEAYARERIKKCDALIVICGEHTGSAEGVASEVRISIEENIPYFLLKGKKCNHYEKPSNTNPSDKVRSWNALKLRALFRRFH